MEGWMASIQDSYSHQRRRQLINLDCSPTSLGSSLSSFSSLSEWNLWMRRQPLDPGDFFPRVNSYDAEKCAMEQTGFEF